MIDLNEMVVFAAVVEQGSFTRAAAQLDMPKSTVSRKVAQLEERLGLRLLERTTRRLRLTDTGAEYYARCRRLRSDAEAADRLVAEHRREPQGLLRVAAPINIARMSIGRLTTEFLQRYPKVRGELVVSSRRLDFVDRAIDVAFWIGRMRDSTLVVRKLGATRPVICASPRYLARRGTPRSPAELAEHSCLLFGAGRQSGHWTLEGPGGRESAQVSGRFVANNLSMLHEAARAGLGIAILSAETAAADLRRGDLVRILEEWRLPPGALYLVYPSRRHQAPRVRAYIDHIVASFPA